MSAPFQSPESDAIARLSQAQPITPSIQDDFTIFSSLAANLVDKGVGLFNQSLESQNQINLNKIESEGLRILEEGRAAAVTSVNPTQIKPIYDEAVQRVAALTRGLQGGDRAAIENSLFRTTTIHRAKHVLPHQLNLQRQAQEASSLRAHNTNLQQASTGDLDTTQNAVENALASGAREIAQGVPESVVEARLGKRITQIHATHANTLMQQKRYEDGLKYLRDIKLSGGMNAIVRGTMIQEMLQARSQTNFDRNSVSMAQGNLDLRGERGRVHLQAMIESEELTSTHWRMLELQRLSTDRGVPDRDDKIQQELARAFMESQVKGTTIEQELNPQLGEDIQEGAIEFIVSQRILSEQLAAEDEARLPKPAAQIGLEYATETGRIGAQTFTEALTLAQHNPEDITTSIQGMNRLRALENSAPWRFDSLNATPESKQIIDLMHAYRKRLYGEESSADNLANSRMVWNAESGDLQYEVSGVIPQMSEETAYRQAFESKNPGADTPGAQNRDQRMNAVNALKNDGGHIAMANDALNEVFNRGFGRGIDADQLANIRPLVFNEAIELFITGEQWTLPEAFESAAIGVAVTRGYFPDKFNTTPGETGTFARLKRGLGFGEEEIQQFGLGHPAFSMATDGIDQNGRGWTLGLEPYRAEMIFRSMEQMFNLASGPVEAKKIRAAIDELKADGIFTSGHILFADPKSGFAEIPDSSSRTLGDKFINSIARGMGFGDTTDAESIGRLTQALRTTQPDLPRFFVPNVEILRNTRDKQYRLVPTNGYTSNERAMEVLSRHLDIPEHQTWAFFNRMHFSGDEGPPDRHWEFWVGGDSLTRHGTDSTGSPSPHSFNIRARFTGDAQGKVPDADINMAGSLPAGLRYNFQAGTNQNPDLMTFRENLIDDAEGVASRKEALRLRYEAEFRSVNSTQPWIDLPENFRNLAKGTAVLLGRGGNF